MAPAYDKVKLIAEDVVPSRDHQMEQTGRARQEPDARNARESCSEPSYRVDNRGFARDVLCVCRHRYCGGVPRSSARPGPLVAFAAACWRRRIGVRQLLHQLRRQTEDFLFDR